MEFNTKRLEIEHELEEAKKIKNPKQKAEEMERITREFLKLAKEETKGNR
jgi:hypothetical protein